MREFTRALPRRGITWVKTDSMSRRISFEGVLFAFIYFAYRLGQGLVSDQYPKAAANAATLIDWEKSIGMYFELQWHQFFMDTGLMMEVINWYYENMHFPVTLLALVTVFLHYHNKYGIIRNYWLLFTVGAFIVQWIVPMMPPRLMPELGFIDISSTRPGGIYSEDELGPLTNQIAAMPSVHFGWSMIAATSIIYVRRHWTSWLALIHPAATFVAIVATANHWMLDAVFALPILAAAFLIARLDLHHKVWVAFGQEPFRRDMPAVDPRPFLALERRAGNFRGMAAVSLAVFVAALAFSWNWFDVDEFANLQEAFGVAGGQMLYVDLASHHPPLYVFPFLAFLVGLPGSTLLWARVASMLMTWGAGVLGAHMFWRRGYKKTSGAFFGMWTLNLFVLLAGTRAMNEVPVLFLLVLAAWLYTSERDDKLVGVLVGAILAVSFMTRFTTVFFAVPFLFINRQRLPYAIVSGAATITAILAFMWTVDANLLQGFLDQAVLYQSGRVSIGRVFAFAQILLGIGILVIASVWHFVPELRPRRNRWSKLAMVAFLGLLAMLMLPRVYIHYFLPIAPVMTAFAAAALMKKGLSTVAKQVIIGAVLLTGILLMGIYFSATPHNSLSDAKDVGAWVEAHTDEDALVLTDAPEYAILGHRENWGSYFWNLRENYSAAEMNETLSEVQLLIASERLANGNGYPEGFVDYLVDLPCLEMGTVSIYWTQNSTAPAEMIGCT
jgi:hypothetical protein